MESSVPMLSPALEQVVRDHLALLHNSIRRRAQTIALDEAEATSQASIGTPEITAVHCLKAITQVAPGERIAIVVDESIPFWHRFASSVSPITLISSFLTVVFAAFGLWALSAKGSSSGSLINGGAYLDIAKIFAGAIVGSASVGAASISSKRTISVEPNKAPKKSKA